MSEAGLSRELKMRLTAAPDKKASVVLLSDYIKTTPEGKSVYYVKDSDGNITQYDASAFSVETAMAVGYSEEDAQEVLGRMVLSAGVKAKSAWEDVCAQNKTIPGPTASEALKAYAEQKIAEATSLFQKGKMLQTGTTLVGAIGARHLANNFQALFDDGVNINNPVQELVTKIGRGQIERLGGYGGNDVVKHPSLPAALPPAQSV